MIQNKYFIMLYLYKVCRG